MPPPSPSPHLAVLAGGGEEPATLAPGHRVHLVTVPSQGQVALQGGQAEDLDGQVLGDGGQDALGGGEAAVRRSGRPQPGGGT